MKTLGRNHKMTELEFLAEMKSLSNQRITGNLTALETGKKYRELCEEYLQDHDELPEGYS